MRDSPSSILLVYSPNSMLLLLVFHGSLVNTRVVYTRQLGLKMVDSNGCYDANDVIAHPLSNYVHVLKLLSRSVHCETTEVC